MWLLSLRRSVLEMKSLVMVIRATGLAVAMVHAKINLISFVNRVTLVDEFILLVRLKFSANGSVCS